MKNRMSVVSSREMVMGSIHDDLVESVSVDSCFQSRNI